MAGSGQTTDELMDARGQGDPSNPQNPSSLGYGTVSDHQMSGPTSDCAGEIVDAFDWDGTDPEQASSALISAVWEGDVEAARNLLRAGAEPSREDSLGAIPLHIASTLGNCRLVRLLLAAGADADSEDMYGHSPLHKAAFGGHVDVVRALLDAGACAPGTLAQDTPLHHAAGRGHVEIVKLLLEYENNNIHRPDCDGESPLHRACHGGHFDVVCYLASLGADLHARLPKGRQPLHLASDCRCGPSLADLFGTEDNNFGEYSYDVEECTCFGVGRHHDAAQVVCFLIENGCDVNSLDHLKETPLHCAARHPDVKVVELLLAAASDIKNKNIYHETPLHEACSHGHPGVVKSLIEHGADLQAVTSYGATPVHLAFQHKNNGTAMLQTVVYLMSYGSPFPEEQVGIGYGNWQKSVLLYWAGYYDTAAMVRHFLLSLESSADDRFANFVRFLLVLQPTIFKSSSRNELLLKMKRIPTSDRVDQNFNNSVAMDLYAVSPLYQLAMSSIRNHISSIKRGSSIIPSLEKLSAIISRSITDNLLYLTFIRDILPEVFV